jgi:hypothetical protein
MSAVALAEAWRKIVRAGTRRGPDELGLLDEALGDVQLFGSPAQVRRAAAVAEAINAGEPHPRVLDALLEALRDDIRAELHLDAAPQGVVRVRPVQSARPDRPSERPLEAVGGRAAWA